MLEQDLILNETVSTENSKQRLRVVFGRNPPDAYSTCNQFPTMQPSIDCPFPGWTTELMSMLADYLRIEIEPFILDDNVGSINWGYNNNGNWTGVLGMLQRGDVDTICVMFHYVEDHSKYFSYSNPVTGVRDVYIARPKRKSISMAIWNAMFPYEISVWAIILGALFLQGLLATVITKIEYKLNLRTQFHLLEKFWQYTRLHIRQSTEFQAPFFLKSGNLSFIIYAVMQATLFTNLYTAVILSALIQGQNPQPWDSFHEMVSVVKSGEYTMVIDRLAYEEGWFMEAMSLTSISHLRNLHDAIKKNPLMVVPTVFEALDLVERGGYIFPTHQDSLALQLSRERCDLFYFEDDNSQLPIFFIFTKDSPFLQKWNNAIRHNQPFIRRTFEKYFLRNYKPGSIPKCPDNGNDIPEAFRPLDIISTFGIFMIVLIGFGTSIIVFFFELYVHSQAVFLRNRHRTRRAIADAPKNLLAIVQLMARKREIAISIYEGNLQRNSVDNINCIQNNPLEQIGRRSSFDTILNEVFDEEMRLRNTETTSNNAYIKSSSITNNNNLSDANTQQYNKENEENTKRSIRLAEINGQWRTQL